MEKHPHCQTLPTIEKSFELYIYGNIITNAETYWLTPYGLYISLREHCPDTDLFSTGQTLGIFDKDQKQFSSVGYQNNLASVSTFIPYPLEILTGFFIGGMALYLYWKKKSSLPIKVKTPTKEKTILKAAQASTMKIKNTKGMKNTFESSMPTRPPVQRSGIKPKQPAKINRFTGYQKEETILNKILSEQNAFFRIDKAKKVLITPKTVVYPLERARSGKFTSLYTCIDIMEAEIFDYRCLQGHEEQVNVLALKQPICLILPRVDPIKLEWSQRNEGIKSRHMLIGLSYVTGRPKVSTIDLDSPTQFSVLLGGSSGSGKSTLLDGMILSACESSDPADFKLTIVDIGLKHFAEFTKLPHCNQCCSTLDDTLKTLQSIVESMIGPEDSYQYRTAIVIDEIQKLTKCGDDVKEKELKRLLMMIASNGRAYGYSIIISTQKPNAGTVPTDIRDNCVTRIAGRCISQSQSEMILGYKRTEATQLNGVGSFIVDDGNTTKIVYSYIVDVKQEIKAIQDRYSSYVKPTQIIKEPSANPPVLIPEEILEVFDRYDTGEGSLRRGWQTNALKAYGIVIGKSHTGDNYAEFKRIIITMSKQYLKEQCNLK